MKVNPAALSLESSDPKPAKPSSQPEFRFTASGALSVITSREKELQYQQVQDSLVYDAFDRVPPYDPAALANDGEAYRANADFGDAEAAITDRVEQLNNMMTQPCPHISARTKQGTDMAVVDGIELFLFRLHEFLMQSENYVDGMHNLAFQMTSVGVGWACFGTPGSWHFSVIPRINVIYPKDGKKDISKLPWLAVRDQHSIVDLIAKLEKPDAAAAVGWNIPNIKLAISDLKFNNGTVGGNTIENAPDKWIEGVSLNSYQIAAENGQNVTVYRHYVREYDNMVSEQIFLRSAGSAATVEKDLVLYQSKKRLKCFREVIVPFFLSVGSSYLEKVRGFGHRILPHTAVQNDLLCRSIDLTIISNSLLLKNKSAEDAEKVQREVRFGSAITMIPDDVEVDQKSFGNPASGLIALEQNIRGRRDANRRVFGGTDGSMSDPQMTARQATLKYGENTRGAGYEADRLTVTLTAFHKLLWQRMLAIFTSDSIPPVEGRDELKDFWNTHSVECGITAADLKNIINVKATSMIGDGDPNQVFMALTDLGPYIPSLPMSSQREALRMLIAARTRKADLAFKWVPTRTTEADREESLQNWRASQEEGQFEGSDIPVPVQDDDNNLYHAESHTKYAVGVLDSYSNGVLSPGDAFKKLFRARAHTTIHIERLMQNKLAQSQLAVIRKQWQGIENMMRRMQQQVQEAAQAEQQRQLEMMRNPPQDEKAKQAIQTAELQRQHMQVEHEARLQALDNETQTKAAAVRREQLLKAQLDTIQTAATIGSQATEEPLPTPRKK